MMKKISLLFLFLITAIFTFGQPLTGTKAIPGDYSTISAAVADLNNKGVGIGGVSFNIAPGYTETTSSTISVTATGTALSPIVFQKIGFGPNPVITAYVGTATPSSAIQDGIWKLVGSDYVTIDRINLTDPNTANPATMEYGYGLFKKNAGDGCMHNCIKNCVVTLNRVNNATGTLADMHGSRAINMVNSLDNSQNVTLTPTGEAGTNSYNQFFCNTLQNCNIGIALYGFNAPAPFSLGDTGNDIGGSSAATGNRVINFGGAPLATNSTAGIRVNHQWGINISYNTVNNNNGSGVNHPHWMYGIYAESGTSAGVSVRYNSVAVYGGGTTQNVYGIFNGIGSTPSSNTVVVSNNTIMGSYPTAATGAFLAIQNNANAATVSIASNTISGITLSGSGTFWGINVGVATNVSLSANVIRNLTRIGAGTVYGVQLGNAAILAQNNTIDGLFSTATSGTIILNGIYSNDSPVNETYSNNIVTNLSSVVPATITGLYIGANPGEKTVTGNDLKNFTSAGGGVVYGLNSISTGMMVIRDNLIHDLSVTGIVSGDIYGFTSGNATSQTIFKNRIYALSCAGGAAGNVAGFLITGGTANQVYKNMVYNLSSGSSSPAIYGVCFTAGTTNNLYNNYISELSTPLANASLPLTGIRITGGTTNNVFHNTVYLSASSSGALFGSAALYVNTGATLDLRNNILVNVSTPKGAGVTSAFRRSSNNLVTYSVNSNSNDYYAGAIQDAAHAVYYDGTTPYNLAGFQALVGPLRDNSSFMELPPFISTATSPNNLHMQISVPSSCESSGLPVTTPIVIGDDFDGDIRQGNQGYQGTGLAPDAGADEFDGIPNFTCAIPVPGNTLTSANNLCNGQTTTLSLQNQPSGVGLSYQWQSSPTGILYTDIPGATLSTCTLLPSASMFYRCRIVCLNGPVAVASTPVNILFNNNVLSTTPGNRCGTGTVQLAATCNSGATLRWYSSPSGGSSIATGPLFTTPVISSTTNYYVAAESNISGTRSLGSGALLSSAYENPFFYNYGGQKNQFLVKASELTVAGLVSGNLTALSFDVASSFGVTYQGFNISIGHTALNTLTATLQTGLTNVFSTASPAGVTPATGIFTINFATPFAWDGSSNIIVETCWSNNNSGSIANSAVLRYDASSFTASSYYMSDNKTPPVLCATTAGYGTYDRRVKMLIAGAIRCSSSRVEVAATVTPPPALILNGDQTVCNNAAATIQVTSNLANFNSYVWTPAINLFQDPACTMAYVAGSSKTMVYAKTSTAGTTVYACTAVNSTSFCENSATVAITILATGQTIIAMPGAICGSGNALLTISPSTGYGSSTFQWQSSANNVTFSNIAGATNLSYSTPVISTTTHYRLQIMNNGNLCAQPSYSLVVGHPQITGTTPGSHCGAGNVTLGATAADGTATWFATSTGGSSLGNGALFVTPVIETTTTYFVEAVNTWTGTAQTGNGTNLSAGFESPFYHYYGGLKNQSLIKASDLEAAGLAAGNITALSFDVVSSDGITLQGFNLSMGHTALNNLTATFQTGLSNLFSSTAPAGVTPTNGIFTITFSTPFTWDGTSNIIVETCWSNNNYGISNSNSRVKVDPGSYVSQTYKQVDMQTPAILCPTASANVTTMSCPKMIFTGQIKCESPRTGVAATIIPAPQVTPSVSPASVCAGHPATLSVGNPNPGYTYTWNPGNLNGAVQIVYPDATTIYTSTATTNGTACSSSSEITATVLNSPSPIAITPAAPVISPGTIQPLTASGGQITGAVVLSENFNGATNNWTTINNSTGGNPAAAAWILRPDGYYYDGSQLATFHSNDNTQFYLTNSDAQGSSSATFTILQSPAFSTAGLSSVNLGFFHHFNEYSGSYGKAEASTDGLSWTTLQTFIATAGAANNFVSANVALLPQFLNQPVVYVRFYYYGPWAWWWAIDNVTITGSNESGKVVWSPVTALYTDAAATIPYTGGPLMTVFAKPAATSTYTATSINPVNGCDRTGSVTVTIPTVPENFNVNGDVIGNGQTICYNATNTITASNFVVESNGDAHFIAGSRIFFNPPVKIYPGGYLLGKIAPGGPFCSSTKMTEVAAGIKDTPRATEIVRFILYPNPTNGNFTLFQKGDRTFGNVRVDVYNMNGGKVLSENLIGEQKHEFLFSDMPAGIYFVKLVAEDYTETLKLVKTR